MRSKMAGSQQHLNKFSNSSDDSVIHQDDTSSYSSDELLDNVFFDKNDFAIGSTNENKKKKAFIRKLRKHSTAHLNVTVPRRMPTSIISFLGDKKKEFEKLDF